MKKVISTIIALSLFTNFAFADKKEINAVKTISKKEGVYLQLRTVAQALGYKVEWDRQSFTTKLTKGKEVIFINNKKNTILKEKDMIIKLDKNIILQQGISYILIDDMNNYLDFDIMYKNDKVIAEIDDKKEVFVITGYTVKSIDDKGVAIIQKENGDIAHILPNKDNRPRLSKDDIDKTIYFTVNSLVQSSKTPPIYSSNMVEEIFVVPEHMSQMSGKVKSNSNINKKSILIQTDTGEVVINLDEHTKIINKKSKEVNLSDIKENDTIIVYHSKAMTRSLPPQTYGYVVIVDK